ncbi:MAG: hypothetical protein AAF648_16790 [Pseudomonadota bacterium]
MSTFDIIRKPLYWRIFWAGPAALIGAVIVMAGMAAWLPAGAGQVNNLVIPLVIFPLIWAVLFFHAILDSRLSRVAGVSLTASGLSAVVLAVHFTTLT